MPVTVEFLGLPRLRAGCASVRVDAGTMADVLRAVEQACPGLGGLLIDGRISAHVLVSINGRRFVDDVRQPVSPGDCVLLLSADAGG